MGNAHPTKLDCYEVQFFIVKPVGAQGLRPPLYLMRTKIADEMEQWLIEEGSDRFNIMFPFPPEGLNDFVDKVIP